MLTEVVLVVITVVLTLLGQWAWDAWKKHRVKKTREVTESALRSVQTSVKSPATTKMLAQIYSSHELLTREGVTYPVAIFRPPPSQETLNSILGDLGVEERRTFGPDDPTYDPTYRLIRESLLDEVRTGQRQDEAHYCLSRLETRPSLRIHARLGTFFDAYDTSDSLLFELKESFPHCHLAAPSYDRCWRSLRLRSRLHGKVADPVVDGTSRAAAIGWRCTVIRHNPAP